MGLRVCGRACPRLCRAHSSWHLAVWTRNHSQILPAIVTVPYGIAGKLGITVPLGLARLGPDSPRRARQPARASLPAALPYRRKDRGRSPAWDRTARSGGDEAGEPLADEVPSPAQTAPKPGKKIAALAGGFGGRRCGCPADNGRAGRAMRASRPAPGSGQVVLSSAKYLNKNPGGSFRKGSTQSHDEE